MQVYVEGATDIGCVRKNNQDSIYFDAATRLFLVADGMGGHAGGEIASQMVVEHFTGLSQKDLPYDQDDVQIQLFFEQCLKQVSLKIYLRAIEDPTYAEMGTTCSMMWVHRMKAYVAHAGDSRIYLQRNKFLYQLTEDHSFVAGQLKAGLITESQSKDHALKNVITRSIGYRKEEHVDVFCQDLHSGDKLLLCSDGLYNKVDDHVISQTLSGDVENKSEHFVQMARDGGGEDNISVVIVEIM